MESTPPLHQVAALLADPARAAMLWALIDGSSRSAGALAFEANVSASSASRHLGLLVAAGLLTARPLGRQRHFRIADAEVACLVEGMATLSGTLGAASNQARPRSREFVQARCCYDHLAGRWAVCLLRRMRGAGWLQEEGPEFVLTLAGEAGFLKWGVAVAPARGERRVLARPCPDLTEQAPHLGGALGAALLRAMLAQGWVLRARGSRTLSVTPQGHAAVDAVLPP